MKIQRAFWMQVQGSSQTWTFQSPLTLEMDIARAAWSSLATGTFRIYNLAESTRSDIYQDWNDQGNYRQVIIRAGYKSWASVYGPPNPNISQKQTMINALPIIFQGNITKAYSQREGASWVTSINAWDGGFATTRSYINTPLQAGISTTQQFRTLIAAMAPHATEGWIDPSLSVPNQTGVAFVGSPWEKILQMAQSMNAQAFIDLEKVYVIGNGNFLESPILGGLQTISPATGLLDTPMKQNLQLSFDMIFEPRLKVGQPVALLSIETVNNGTYPIIGLDHVGTISDAVGGDMRTRVYCFYTQGVTGNGPVQ